MLDPSSSEDTGAESDPEVAREPQRKPSVLSAAKKGGNVWRTGGERLQSTESGGAPGRGAKGSPSAGDDEEEKKERERAQKEEKERRTKLQIYVFVLRCISYPFNAKQPTDMARRQQKTWKPQFQTRSSRPAVQDPSSSARAPSIS
ncbi:calcium-dependent secretion activator 1-like isoform X2 [Fundulus heteroclitus]|uniref:calcium-dependent secretion activator 1-like isoform X2 n=1 Tax=Fundulus heteroclitus TaxID=8078 RepID=UPI00165B6542|nr:calcium-dependent secretion activator 1-like isoform X2 [Fundulus heteroclitus]